MEVELYTESALTLDILFEMNMMKELIGKKLGKPKIIGDNMVAIFLTKNLAVHQWEKHIDEAY